MLQPQQPERSQRRHLVLVLLALLLLVSCLSLLAGVILRSSSTASSASSGSTASSSRVSVVLYGESLCPDCRHMVLDVIDPMMKNGLGDAVALRYVASGNVRRGPADEIQCQHGEQECLMNKYINCAQEDGVGSADVARWFPYVACLAEDLAALRSADSYEGRADECASRAGLSASSLKQCAEGSRGETLERRAAEETGALVPMHQFVPWMTVNGAALGADYDNLDRFVCVGVGSGEKPAACETLRDALMHQY